jgi:hypothetical protein
VCGRTTGGSRAGENDNALHKIDDDDPASGGRLDRKRQQRKRSAIRGAGLEKVQKICGTDITGGTGVPPVGVYARLAEGDEARAIAIFDSLWCRRHGRAFYTPTGGVSTLLRLQEILDEEHVQKMSMRPQESGGPVATELVHRGF